MNDNPGQGASEPVVVVSMSMTGMISEKMPPVDHQKHSVVKCTTIYLHVTGHITRLVVSTCLAH